MNLPVKNLFSKKFLDQKTTIGSSTINLFCPCLVLHFSFYEPVVYPGSFGCSRVMATDSKRDPDAVGRFPPYSGRVLSPRDVEPRFLDSPHLTLLLVNAEHLRAILMNLYQVVFTGILILSAKL